jgi:hypothetical protein
MKRNLGFLGVILAVLLVFGLSNCDGLLGPEKADVEEYTDVEYLTDSAGNLKGITLYLDGVGVPTSQAQRALHKNLAKMSHDYFEAVFVGDTDGTTVARAEWEIGYNAGIRGVYRTQDGVDYSVTNRAAFAASSPGTAGTGAATVFVGRKDGTLLAVGILTHVDDPTGASGAGDWQTLSNGVDLRGNHGDGTGLRLLTTSSRSVTFTVGALYTRLGRGLTSGAYDTAITSWVDKDGTVAGTPNYENFTSFVTNALSAVDLAADPVVYNDTADPSLLLTEVYTTVINEVLYPLFNIRMERGRQTVDTRTVYTVGLDNSAPLAPGGEFVAFSNEHLAGMMLAGVGVAGVRVPRMLHRGVNWDVQAEVYTGVKVAMTSNQTVVLNTTTFDPVIAITITTSNPVGEGIFGLHFKVPVFAITNAESTNGAANHMTWYVKTAYGSNFYNLDDGLNAGGLVLMSIDVVSLDWLEIYVIGVGLGD